MRLRSSPLKRKMPNIDKEKIIEDSDGFLSLSNSPKKSKTVKVQENWRKDFWQISLLMVLYTLQGIPMGLAGSVPLILAESGATLSDQATFAMVSTPYSIKLLWAPIVDSIYNSSFGKRKSWIVPVQLLVGVLLLILSFIVDELLTTKNVNMLTVYFFMLYFLVATQDIAVDGWALTLLSPENTGYASTCNSVGQTIGFFTAYTIFLALNSKDFCNSYIRSTPLDVGLVSLSSFMAFWGVVFITVTMALWIGKRENVNNEDNEEKPLPLSVAYKQIYEIVKLPSILSLSLVLLTCKIGVSAAESASSFRFLAAGMPREHMAMLGVMFFPIEVIFTTYIGKWTAGPQPLRFFLRGFEFRLLFSIFYAVLVYYTPNMHGNKEIPYFFYFLLLLNFCFHRMACSLMFTSQMSFFAKVSRLNANIGGTYMTFLNTVSNFGSMWITSPVLKGMDMISVKNCLQNDVIVSSCYEKKDEDHCLSLEGGSCLSVVDGYFIMCALCTVSGVIWWFLMKNKIQKIEHYSESEWICTAAIELEEKRQENDSGSDKIPLIKNKNK